MNKKIENKELIIIINESNLETQKSESIIKTFEEYFLMIDEWSESAKGLIVESDKDIEKMKVAKELRLVLKNKRCEIENKRKELKEQSLREGQAIDKVAKLLKSKIEPIEEHLENQEKFIEIQNKKRKEELNSKRILELQPYDIDIQFINLADMPEEKYQEFLRKTIESYNAKIELQKKIEQEKIEKEQKDKIENERIRIENEKLKKENEDKEKLLKLEREKAEKEKQELLKKQQELERIEFEKKEKERLEKERLEKLGDKGLLTKLRDDLNSIEYPVCVNSENKIIVEKVKATMKQMIDTLTNKFIGG